MLPVSDEKCVDYLLAEAADREKDEGSRMAQRGLVRSILEGDAGALWNVMVGPEQQVVDRPKQMVVANVMLAAGEGLARRVAMRPTLRESATKPNEPDAVRRAARAEGAVRSWWQDNTMDLVNRQAAKFLLAYDSCPIVIRPDMKRKIPCFEERDPLSAFPGDTHTFRPTPADIIFSYKRPLRDLQARFPMAELIPGQGGREIDVLESMDKDEWTFAARDVEQFGNVKGYLLERIPNRTGEPMFVVPKLIAFGSRHGAFDQMIGLLASMARLMMLSLVAAERQVFPDRFISGRIKGNLQIGPDALTMLDDNAKVMQLSYQSAFQFYQEIDRLMGALRIGGEFPSQMSGETPSTLATGRGNEVLMSASVDQGVRERQDVMGEAFRVMIEKGKTLARAGYWSAGAELTVRARRGRGSASKAKMLTYVPSRDLAEGTADVEYGMLSATDAAQATVIIGQLLGTGLLDEITGRDIHPFIDDPELVGDRVKLQRVDRAILLGLEAMVQQGQLDPRAVGRVKTLIREGKELEEAMEEVLGPPEETAAPEMGLPGLPGAMGATPPQGPPAPEEILAGMFGGGA